MKYHKNKIILYSVSEMPFCYINTEYRLACDGQLAVFTICILISAYASSLFCLENIAHNKSISLYSSNLICYIYNCLCTSSCNYISRVPSMLWMPLEEWSGTDTNNHLVPSPNLMLMELLGLHLVPVPTYDQAGMVLASHVLQEQL